MSETAKQWEGQVIDGRFPLQRYLGRFGRSAVFLTERHEGGQPVRAAIKLISSDPESDDLQLDMWQAVKQLSHPHLLSLFESGRCQIGELPFLYAVMECAEENLAEVLPSRALTADEVRAMLDDVLQALTYLHGKGLVHAHIKPDNIMANGDRLKLSADGILRAAEVNGPRRSPSPYDAPESARGVIPIAEAPSPHGISGPWARQSSKRFRRKSRRCRGWSRRGSAAAGFARAISRYLPPLSGSIPARPLDRGRYRRAVAGPHSRAGAAPSNRASRRSGAQISRADDATPARRGDGEATPSPCGSEHWQQRQLSWSRNVPPCDTRRWLNCGRL